MARLEVYCSRAVAMHNFIVSRISRQENTVEFIP